jgi:hypothetical protein
MNHLEGPEITAAVAAAVSWKLLQPAERAAAYLAATSGGRRIIPPHNIAFVPARNLNLVGEDGGMHDLVFHGLELALSSADASS